MRIALCALLLLGCSKTSDGSSAGSGKTWSAAPAPALDSHKTYTATLVTKKGTIELSLDAKAAPITVNNFVFLGKEHFYDGLKFHRVVPGFVIQGGDPKGDGSGGPGYTIQDEKTGLKHDTGALAMAKTNEPNSAGSQFYITLAPQPSLDAGYTVFGHVTAGQEVVAKIEANDVIDKLTINEN